MRKKGRVNNMNDEFLFGKVVVCSACGKSCYELSSPIQYLSIQDKFDRTIVFQCDKCNKFYCSGSNCVPKKCSCKNKKGKDMEVYKKGILYVTEKS
jgi:hypothetical protein